MLVVGAYFVLRRPEQAPGWVVVGLASGIWPLGRAWRGTRGSALRSAVVWAGLAVVLGIVGQAAAVREPLAGGRPGAGHWTYLATLAALAALLSVLNARRPGSGAWALLMALLVLVLLIPWLEGTGLMGLARAPARGGGRGLARLRLESPWTLFYGLLVLAGVTNYLPTRFGPAAASLALGFGLAYAALTHPDWLLARRGAIWSAVPWTLALALWAADACSRWPGGMAGRSKLERIWAWFRDGWGVVWALRVQERFNRAAEAARWPIRLAWFGVVPAEPGGARSGLAVPEAAEATLKGLLRRFADPERIDAVARSGDRGDDRSSGVHEAV